MSAMGARRSGATVTTAADIRTHRARGPWRALETLAMQMVLDAAHVAKCDFQPVLGAGTRLLLAMSHRISTLESALMKMRASSTADLVRHSIRTPQVPGLPDTVDWAIGLAMQSHPQWVDLYSKTPGRAHAGDFKITRLFF